jgi:hypothetical protein
MRKTFTGGGVLGRQSTNCVGVRIFLGAESTQLHLLPVYTGATSDHSQWDEVLVWAVRRPRHRAAFFLTMSPYSSPLFQIARATTRRSGKQITD